MGNVDCKNCGRKNVPNWDDEGNCITCARDQVLGRYEPEPEVMSTDSELKNKILDKIHLAVRTDYYAKHVRDMHFLAEDIESLLTEATREAEAEALKKGLDLANRIDGCHGCMGLSEGMSEEYQKLEKRLAKLQRTKNKEEGATWPVDTNENKRIIP